MSAVISNSRGREPDGAVVTEPRDVPRWRSDDTTVPVRALTRPPRCPLRRRCGPHPVLQSSTKTQALRQRNLAHKTELVQQMGSKPAASVMSETERALNKALVEKALQGTCRVARAGVCISTNQSVRLD